MAAFALQRQNWGAVAEFPLACKAWDVYHLALYRKFSYPCIRLLFPLIYYLFILPFCAFSLFSLFLKPSLIFFLPSIISSFCSSQTFFFFMATTPFSTFLWILQMLMSYTEIFTYRKQVKISPSVSFPHNCMQPHKQKSVSLSHNMNIFNQPSLFNITKFT